MDVTSIDPDIVLGCVSLTVGNLNRSVDFYEEVIGLEAQQTSPTTASLWSNDIEILRLTEVLGARRVTGAAGLYHFAIVVPSRADLARSIQRLLATGTPLQGFADHFVSEAVYLTDPDGNGIEIYRDRPRDSWPKQEGKLVMGTEPIDLDGLLNELDRSGEAWQGLAPGSRIGHVHLQVSHLEQAETFYRQVLGFDLVMRYGPSATFLSAGGYHHHIGCNTWAGTGVPAAPAGAVGLNWYAIDFPDSRGLEACLQRAENAAVVVENVDQGLLVRDPSGNGVLLRIGRS